MSVSLLLISIHLTANLQLRLEREKPEGEALFVELKDLE